jgi:hypothetical protein
MMTFAHRDQRLNEVNSASAAIGTRIAALKALLRGILTPLKRRTAQAQLLGLDAASAALRKEQTGLSSDSFETGDFFAKALARQRLWNDGPRARGTMRADPVYGAAKQPMRLTAAMAAAIGALPRTAGPSRQEYLEEAATAAGDAQAMEQIIGSALGQWWREDTTARISPFLDIGIMLPLRLETIFDERDGVWEMSLRVVPDEVSIRRDQPNVTEIEKSFLDEFWARSESMAPAPGTHCSQWLAHAEGAVAWEQLAARVTPARAAWLVSTFGAKVDGSAFAVEIPPAHIGPRRADTVFGLPKELTVTVVGINGTETMAGSLRPDLSQESFGIPSGDKPFDNWLLSWDEARRVGMGGVFKLPEGPDRIAALYVHGIGDDSPAELFAAHAATGSLAMMRLGAPTNTVHGAPAADLAADAGGWLEIARQRLTGESGLGVPSLADALCGDVKALPVLPGAGDGIKDQRLMVNALWPALWGHFWRDVLEAAGEATDFWSWCLEALHPEGPLPPVRIGAQPYGLLPVTPLASWQRLEGDKLSAIEAQIVSYFLQIAPKWIEAAETRGTIATADTHGLLNLLARPGVSSRYSYRSYIPAEILATAYQGLGVQFNDFMHMAEKLWSPASDATQHKMGRLYLAQGHPQDLHLPLIGSDRLLPMTDQVEVRDALTVLFKELYDLESRDFALALNEKVLRGVVPKSLLIRLMMHSALLAKAWTVQTPPGVPSPLRNPLQWNGDPTDLEELQMMFPDHISTGDPVENLMEINRDAILKLASELGEHVERGDDPLKSHESVLQLHLPPKRHEELERALRATLDTAGHRIDPLATGVAWRRLRAAAQSGRGLHRLGAYGWLDGPFIGKPGPTDAGRLHAPSHAQAITSIVLRDKQIASRDELAADNRNIWDVKLSSAGVRQAVEMAEEVRMGFHIYEVVGRRVESIVGDRNGVRKLRERKPLRPNASVDRDCCHGIDALDALLSDSPLPGVLTSPATQKPRLEAIRAALESFTDLLTAEGVYQVVTGHADRAADAMDAAAGFARPPEFETVRTPPSGYRLGTSVLGVFAFRTPSEDAAPLELADASLAGFIAQRFQAPTDWIWKVERDPGDVADISLAELGIAPVEAVLMNEDFLAQAARSKAGAPNGKADAPEAHRLSRLLMTALGAGPAVLSDVSKDQGVSDEAARASEEAVQAELKERYVRLATKMKNFIAALQAGAPDEAGKLDLLRKSIVWGFSGLAASAPPKDLAGILFGGEEAEVKVLDALLHAAAHFLMERLPKDEDAVSKQPIAALSRAIGELAAPGGRLTITARWTSSGLRAVSAMDENEDGSAEEGWLAVSAAVRPSLARVEAAQLGARHLRHGAPLGVWSNSAGDPWQTDLVERNAEKRQSGKLTKMTFDRLVVAFGEPEALAANDVAVALIDQFSESVPMPQRSTYGAFGFNAPAARPPQAILLGLPSRPDRRLDADETLRIVRETRDLLRVRAAQPGEATHAALPSAWLEASSALRVRLDAGSQFRR